MDGLVELLPTCPICIEIYCEQNPPFVGNCLHNLCKQCLDKLTKKECPICKMDFKTPKRNIDLANLAKHQNMYIFSKLEITNYDYDDHFGIYMDAFSDKKLLGTQTDKNGNVLNKKILEYSDIEQQTEIILKMPESEIDFEIICICIKILNKILDKKLKESKKQKKQKKLKSDLDDKLYELFIEIVNNYASNKSIDINKANSDGNTLLLLTQDHLKIITTLIKNSKCNFEHINNEKYQLLDYINHDNVLWYEIAKKSNLTHISDGITPLINVCALSTKQYDKFILDLIKTKDCKINFINLEWNDTALHWACWRGKTQVCLELIRKMDIGLLNLKNKHGHTPLSLACRSKCSTIAKAIIKRLHDTIGYNPNFVNYDTAMKHCCTNKMYYVACEILLVYPKSVNSIDRPYHCINIIKNLLKTPKYHQTLPSLITRLSKFIKFSIYFTISDNELENKRKLTEATILIQIKKLIENETLRATRERTALISQVENFITMFSKNSEN
jgi:ankyrin repeat protein